MGRRSLRFSAQNWTALTQQLLGSVDAWLTKGGKSLRFILDEVTALQAELDAQATTSGSAGLIAA